MAEEKVAQSNEARVTGTSKDHSSMDAATRRNVVPAVAYFPPYKLLAKALSSTAQSVTLPLPVFEAMLKQIFLAAGFDSNWYRRAYADVAQAVAKGAQVDEISHFASGGYKEDRMPQIFDVDEQWYRAHYPDVDHSIKQGKIATGHHHYNTTGYLEGRYPNAAAAAEGESWRRLLSVFSIKN